MFKYMAFVLVLGISFLGAENVQELSTAHSRQSSHELQQLENQREALELKLESYKLKKRIIEIQNFIEKDKLEKKERAERKAALIKLKNDLRRNRYKRRVFNTYGG